MERTKRMLIVLLTSFGIFALLTFLTFSSYGKDTSQSLTTYKTQTKSIMSNSHLKQIIRQDFILNF